MNHNEDTMDRVMLIAAHPDDPEFGCGGTIAKWASQGKQITYVLLTSGDKGSHDPEMKPAVLAAIREKEQREAARVLGVNDVVYLRHPDGLLENSIGLRRQLAELIRRCKPHVLLAIDPWRHYQLHPDHRAAGAAALDAMWSAREWNIFPEQLADESEPWRVKEVYLFWTDHADYWEDVSCCIDRRIDALACHVSQVGDDRERLDVRIRERSRQAGQQPGYEYAEAFKRFEF